MQKPLKKQPFEERDGRSLKIGRMQGRLKFGKKLHDANFLRCE